MCLTPASRNTLKICPYALSLWAVNNIYGLRWPKRATESLLKGKVFPVNDNTPAYYMTDNWMLYQNF